MLHVWRPKIAAAAAAAAAASCYRYPWQLDEHQRVQHEESWTGLGAHDCGRDASVGRVLTERSDGSHLPLFFRTGMHMPRT